MRGRGRRARGLCRADRHGRLRSSPATPTGFIPEQDQGYLITSCSCRRARRLSGPSRSSSAAIDIILKTPGVEHVAPFAGLDATTFTVASNAGTIFSGLPSLYNHELRGITANSVLADLRKRLSVIQDAYVLTIPPPPVQGIGNAGGFKMMLEDRAGLGSEALVEGRQRAGGRRQQGSELRRRVHAVQRGLAVGLCRYRSRESREGRADADRRVQRRCRSISARNTSTTSIISAAPTRSSRRPTAASGATRRTLMA